MVPLTSNGIFRILSDGIFRFLSNGIFRILSDARLQVIITDGCAGAGCLHAYISKTPGSMVNFVAATQPGLSAAEHPPFGPAGSFVNGDWASDAGQIGFIPDAKVRQLRHHF